MYYAQLNDANICIGVSFLASEVNAGNMLPLDEFNPDLLGKEYMDGTFVEVALPEPPDIEGNIDEIILNSVPEEYKEDAIRRLQGDNPL